MHSFQGRKRKSRRAGSLRDLWHRLRLHPLARLGPGLITGVADDDPSGIATYSQAGAQFGLDMLWTMPLAYPLMAAIQAMCAQIGRVTGKGLAANIKLAFPPIVLKAVVLLLLVANTLNIAADVAAMGEVAELVSGIDRHLMTTVFVLVTLLLSDLRAISPLRLFPEVADAFAARLCRRAVHGPSALGRGGVTNGVAETDIEFGRRRRGRRASSERRSARICSSGRPPRKWRTCAPGRATPLLQKPASAVNELRRIRWDTWSGMLYSDIAAYFIILATAVTLHVSGITDIATAAQAASALRPLAGNFAFILFALGILGVGLIGVPVLAGSAAYALAEAMGWKSGLEQKPARARGFYGVIAVSVLSGLFIQYSPISPMKALFWSAVINGVVAVPLMVVIVLLASSRSVMGAFTSSRPIVILGWIGIAVMGAAAVMMFVPG